MEKYAVEAILFAKGEAVEVSEIAKGIEKSIEETKKICNELKQLYINEKRGLNLLEVENKYQLCSSEVYFNNIRKVVEVKKKQELTEPLLETLAIIAFKQPITRVQIEEIRGVSSSFAINKLMEYGLICEKGRLDFVGRPILFGTTEDFLKFYGINSLDELSDINNN